MCYVAVGFYREYELVRDGFPPFPYSFFIGQIIKSVIDFNGVEVSRIILKVLFALDFLRVEWTLPMLVMPSRSADMNFRFAYHCF